MDDAWHGLKTVPYALLQYAGAVPSGRPAMGRGLLDLVGNEDDEIFVAGLFQAVRTSRTGENGGPGSDVDRFAVERHDAVAAEDVVNPVLVLFVVADAGRDVNARTSTQPTKMPTTPLTKTDRVMAVKYDDLPVKSTRLKER